MRFTFACAVAILGSVAAAQVQVGDKPQFQAHTVDGSNISLKQLEGKIVLMDFWATWCGPCMAEADHMVRVNQQYAPKGLVLVGVSLDQNQAQMQRVCKEKGFVWPQILDTASGKALSNQFGVRGIPHTFLIGPDGTVLWRGHPAQLDEPIAEAFRKSPPRLLDSAAIKAVGEVLEKAGIALKEGRLEEASKSLAKVPAEARKDPELGKRIASVEKEIDGQSTTAMQEAEQLIERKDYAAAVDKLRALSRSGLPVAAKAGTRLTALQAQAEVKSAIDAAEKAGREKEQAAKADSALAAAQKLAAGNKHEQAYVAFKAVAAQFAGTSAGAAARDAVKRYENDPDFVKRAAMKDHETKARAMLTMAGNYRSAGKNAMARQRYQAVMDQFPNTPFAQEARRELEATPAE